MVSKKDPTLDGDTWDRIEKVGLRISDKATGKALKDVILYREEATVVKDLGLQMAVMAFVADFGFDPDGSSLPVRAFEPG